MYQKKTISRAPEHIRNLMRVANDVEKQHKRLKREIEKQIDFAQEALDVRSDRDSARHILKNGKSAGPGKKEDFSGLPWDVVPWRREEEEEEEEDLADMPDFRSDKVRAGNPMCWCFWMDFIKDDAVQKMGYRDAEEFRSAMQHSENCPRASTEVTA